MTSPVKHLGAVLSVLLLCVPLLACTPRPLDPVPVVEEFFAEVSQQDFTAAGSLSDQRTVAATALESSFAGLQAESVEVAIQEVNTSGPISQVSYELRWQLPRQREYVYESAMTLHNISESWQIQWQPQIVHPKLAANQHLELRSVAATKASVQSSDGVELLTPGTVNRVYIDASEFSSSSSAEATAQRISRIFDSLRALDTQTATVDAEELAENLQDYDGLYAVGTFPTSLGEDAVNQFAAIQGVSVQQEAAMVNVRPNFATNLLYGVGELAREQLVGANGWTVLAVTAEGAAMQTLYTQEPQVAPTVTVSLDYQVQNAAERAVNLRNDMQTMIVAIRPENGDILAVAQTALASAEGDIALTGLYPPGSTFKTITAAAGIEDAGLEATSIVPCPGTINLQGRTVRNYNGFALGDVSLESAFANSCNTTFAKISTDLEEGQLQEVARQFGIGRSYSVPGLRIATGSVPQGETALERTEAGYGQGDVLVSPFSMALAAATVANDGKTPTPTFVRGQETTTDDAPESLDEDTVAQLRQLMAAVTGPSGTARSMSAPGEFYSKTGEAEIADASHSWFIGYREYEGETIAFATLMVRGGGSELAVSLTDSFFKFLDSANSSAQG